MAESLPDRRPAASHPLPLSSSPRPSYSSSPPSPTPRIRRSCPRLGASLPESTLSPRQPSDAVLSVIFQTGRFPFLPSDILSTLSPLLGRRPLTDCHLPLLPRSHPLRPEYNANFFSYLQLQWRRDQDPPALPWTGTLAPLCSLGKATGCEFCSLRISCPSFFGLCI